MLATSCTAFRFQCPHLSHVWHYTVLRRNNCCQELNSSTVVESQGWTDRLERLRLTVMADGCCTATEPTEIGGYLLQQMGLCTFSTVIRD